MFIQTEATPNPATLKFLPGRTVLDTGTLDLRSRDEAAQSPLAERLFAVDGVSGVFFGSDFIAVTKDEPAEWQEFEATAHAAPPDEPPVECPRFHGLCAGPSSRLSVVASSPYSGVFVLPRITNPASRAFCVSSELLVATCVPKREPIVVFTPLRSSRSFIR